MARTAEGRALTVAHRAAQVKLRAAALRDFRELWPVWTGDERSFLTLIAGTDTLVGAYRGQSAGLATGYVRRFRKAEKITGSFRVKPAEPVNSKALRTSLYVTGENSVRRGLEAGKTAAAARQTALVETSGAVTRHILAGGVGVIVGTALSDQKAGGWYRVTGGNPCAFCAMLASRGSVYAEDTGDFEAHDHCTCMAEPQYPDSELPAESEGWWKTWQDVTKPELVYSERRKKMVWQNQPEILNDFRRALNPK